MKQKLFFLAVLCSISMAMNAQTTNTSPLPAGETIIGNHLHAGAGNEIWTDANSLFFNYQGNASKTYFWNLGGSTGNAVMTLQNNGNVGVGTMNPQANLHIGKQEAPACSIGQSTRLILQPYGHTGGPWKFICRDNASSAFLDLFYGDTHSITIHHSGSVGIGTTTPDQKLTVKGKIHAEEVIVDLNVPVADYVFAKDYSLMPLHKVEQYVQQNSHLPDIPSAAEIKEQGLSMGEMQNKLLKKIEEQTLYIISLNKQITQQNDQMQQLEKRIKELEAK
jgi:hypothetical protein